MSLIFRNFWKIFSLWTFEPVDETPCYTGNLLRIAEADTVGGKASAETNATSGTAQMRTGASSGDYVLCRSRAHKPERRRYTRHGCAADAQFRTAGCNMI